MLHAVMIGEQGADYDRLWHQFAYPEAEQMMCTAIEQCAKCKSQGRVLKNGPFVDLTSNEEGVMEDLLLGP